MSEEIYTVYATSINKIYKIPVKLLSHYYDTIKHNETIVTLQDALDISGDDLIKKVQDAFALEIKAHQAIYEYLGLDYNHREPGTEESYVAVAIHEWKAEKKVTTVTTADIELYV